MKAKLILGVVLGVTLCMFACDAQKQTLDPVEQRGQNFQGQEASKDTEEPWEDISSFGRYKVLEVDYEEDQYLDYYSSGDFEELIGYYSKMLQGTDDYYLSPHQGGDYVEITGTLREYYVSLMISKYKDDSGGDKLTYVNYFYEILEADLERSPQDQEALQDEAIETLTSDGEITLRKDIDTILLQALEDEFMASDYPYTMVARMEGTSVSSEFATSTIAYHAYYRGEDVRLLTFLDGDHKGVTIYNSESDLSCTYTVKDPGHKEETVGNIIPHRLLKLGDLKAMASAYKATYIETLEGRKFVWFDTGRSAFMYDFDDRIIKWYTESWGDSEGQYKIQWHLVDVKYEVDIEGDMFEW